MPESVESPDRESGERNGTYHQIHFAWAEPTLLGRVGPGPSATSLSQPDQPVLRSWRDRLLPALTADYRSALPGVDPGDYPETLWARHYPDGQSALVYRWPGDVRQAHAWAIVGPTRGLTLPRILALHENPNTRPDQNRPPAPGWATMRTLRAPEPWERAATPGAMRTRDRRAAEVGIGDEPLLTGAVARVLAHPERPVQITLDPDRADLWQATQLRFLWGMHRILHDVLTPPTVIPAAGWSWSFSTYDPILGVEDGPHLVFGPPIEEARAHAPFLTPSPLEYFKVAEGLVTLLREQGGDTLAEHLRDRGVPEATTFADRFALLRDWFDPRPQVTETSVRAVTDETEPLPEGLTSHWTEPVASTPDSHLRNGKVLAPEPEPSPAAPRLPEPEEGLQEAPDPFSEEEEGPREREFPVEEPPEPDEFLEPDELPEPEEPPERNDPAGPPGDEEGRHTSESFSVTDREGPGDAPGEGPNTVVSPSAEGHTVSSSAPTEAQAPTPLDSAEGRSPTDAPPLPVLSVTEDAGVLDYVAETEPGVNEEHTDPDDNWPTHYVDLPLARLARWHDRHGPEGARTDVADARAAIRAERAELDRVRGERDHYHAEVQELRRTIARLDQSWIDADPAAARRSPRRLPGYLLLSLLLIVVFAIGLEVGARTGTGALDLLRAIPGLPL
mgnify:CR=1 FL=1